MINKKYLPGPTELAVPMFLLRFILLSEVIASLFTEALISVSNQKHAILLYVVLL